MNLGKMLAPGLTLATTVAGAIGVFDPAIPPSVRTALGAAAAAVIAVYVAGHHLLESAKVKAGGVVAAAKHASALSTVEGDAAKALHAVESMFGSLGVGGPPPTAPPAVAGAALPGSTAPPPAGAPGSNAGIASTPTPGGPTP